MSDAPERIWAYNSLQTGYRFTAKGPQPHFDGVEYIRADLMAELVDVLQRAVDGYGQEMRNATGKKEKRDWQSMLIAAVDIQQAALAKIKEQQA